MVMRASEARADQHAPSEFQAAQTALRDARAAMESSNFDVAQKSLEFAKLHAQHALELTEENKQRLAKDAERQQQAKEAVQREALRAKTAKEAAAERVKREALAAKSDSPSTAKPTAPALAAHYQVGEGETLWTISAQATVYHDALLWPLLYQANRDQI
ncbi:MAG: hypothetical protein OET90_09995, partial [Desulfuromonadales bacterium]|nr:hypothetical protein [Desulfuromonadales bacterium]